MFNINDKVVCVDDGSFSFRDGYPIVEGKLTKGQIYTIEGFTPYEKWWGAKGNGVAPAVWIVGVKRKDNIPFGAYRFRKLSEIKEENKLKNIDKQPLNF